MKCKPLVLFFAIMILKLLDRELFAIPVFNGYPLLLSTADSTKKQLLISTGIDFYTLKKIDSAEYYFNKVLEIDSEDVQANYWLGVLQFNGRKNDKLAERYFLKAVRSEKPDASVYSYLATIYGNRMEWAQAESHYRKALKIDPQNAFCNVSLINIYLKKKRTNDASELVSKLINSNPVTLRLIVNIAAVYLDNNYNSDAEKLYRRVIALDSGYAFAHYRLGSVLSNTERVASANLAFKKAIALDTNFAMSYYGQYVEEQLAYKNIHSLDSNYAQSFYKLGWLYIQVKRYQEAELAYKQAILLDANYALAYNHLGWMYLLTHRYSEAKPNLLKAIQLDSAMASPYTFLAMIDYKSKHLNEAKAAFLKSLKIDPDFAPAMFGMAYLLSSNGETKEAYEYLEQAIQKRKRIRQLLKAEELKDLQSICLLHSLQGLTIQMLQLDQDLELLRSGPKWAELMAKYFPKDGVK